MRKFLLMSALVAFVFNSTACVHAPNQKFEKALSEGRCEDGLENVPDKDGNINFIGRVNQAGGNVLSYAATGAGYTADVLLTVVGGAVIFVALCAPLAAAAMAGSQSGSSISNVGCLPADLSHVSTPHIGRDLYRDTAQMRCPDLSNLSRSIRRVASCQEKREAPEQLRSARKTLSSVLANGDFMRCITKDERAALEVDANRLDTKLAHASGQ